MTEDKNEVAVWTPVAFDGECLLPVGVSGRQVDTIGREHIKPEDMILPTLKLLQGSSEEVKQGVHGARAGVFWLTGADEAFEPPIRVLAVAHHRSRSLFPKADKSEHEGLEECRSRDGETGSRYGDCNSCPYKDWDNEKGRPPACSESHNFTVLTPMGPAILRCARTSFKAGKKIVSSWNMSTDPLFAHPLYLMTSTRTDTVQGRPSTTHVLESRWAQRETVPPGVQAVARALYEQINAAHESGKLNTTEFGDD